MMDFDFKPAKLGVQLVRTAERGRQFGVDHGIDAQFVHLRLRAQLTDRPARPLGIVLEKIDQDIRIDQQHQSSGRRSAIT